MIRVMIADDNKEFNSKCKDFLTKDNEISVVSSTTDGESTIAKYHELMPDILLLDLKLPKKNGLEVINELCKDPQEKKKCNIIVISGSLKMRIKLKNTAKVYHVSSKPVDYDELLGIIKEYNSQSLSEEKIRDFISELGITDSDSTSYDYLIEAIRLTNNMPYLLDNLKFVYSLISQRYGVANSRVQWKIRNNISKIERHLSKDTMESIFHIYSSKTTLTPKHFLIKSIQYAKKNQSTSF